MENTPDGDGSLLDHSLVYCSSEMQEGSDHNIMSNMPVILGGKGNGRVVTGRHMVFPSGTSRTNLLLSLLNWSGVPTTSFGLDGRSVLTQLTTALGVPRDVVAADDQIEHAWSQLPRLIKRIPPELRDERIVKMCVAVASGLFDAAINYVWDAAVVELREKVRRFGIAVVPQVLDDKSFDEDSLLDRTVGNWPDLRETRATRAAGSGALAYSTYWCHGAPGMVATLGHVMDEELALAGGELTWRAGPVRKGPGLCHGTAGLAHTFHRLFRATGDEALREAAIFWIRRTLDQRRPGRGVGSGLLARAGGACPERSAARRDAPGGARLTRSGNCG